MKVSIRNNVILNVAGCEFQFANAEQAAVAREAVRQALAIAGERINANAGPLESSYDVQCTPGPADFRTGRAPVRLAVRAYGEIVRVGTISERMGEASVPLTPDIARVFAGLVNAEAGAADAVIAARRAK